MKITMSCLCGAEVEIQCYDGGQCETCGQAYEYEEGCFPVLDDLQKALLKTLNLRRDRIKEAIAAFKPGVPSLGDKMYMLHEFYLVFRPMLDKLCSTITKENQT